MAKNLFIIEFIRPSLAGSFSGRIIFFNTTKLFVLLSTWGRMFDIHAKQGTKS